MIRKHKFNQSVAIFVTRLRRDSVEYSLALVSGLVVS